jgi:hypothetical protein
LFELRSLTHLDASYNKCTAVPDDLGRGIRLQRLLLKGNTIELNTAFWFENLTALLELDISDNQITSLPVTLGLLTQIQVLRVEGETRQWSWATDCRVTDGLFVLRRVGSRECRQSSKVAAARAGNEGHEGCFVLFTGMCTPTSCGID